MGILIYIIIFIEKLLENLLTALRTLVYTSGHKHLSAVLTFFTTLMWIFITSIVIIDFKSDPLKLIIYAFGQVVGTYLGAKLEEKISLGNSLVYAITPEETAVVLSNELRDNGYGVTSIKANGYTESKKRLLLILLKRKNITKLKEIINKQENRAILMIKKPNSTSGGYIV